MKRKGIILLSSIFACVALIATGFAAFVISITTTGEATGNIEVDEVDDRSFKVTVDQSHDIVDVVFGAKEYEGTNQNPWMVYSDTGKNENLKTTIKVTCTNAAKLDASLFTVTVTSNEAYEAALGEGYVAALPTQASGKITIAQEGTADSNGVGTYIITLNFDWGTTFGGVNPIDYYNDLDAETYAQQAKDNLDSDIFKALSGVAFTVTIAPVPGSN